MSAGTRLHAKAYPLTHETLTPTRMTPGAVPGAEEQARHTQVRPHLPRVTHRPSESPDPTSTSSGILQKEHALQTCPCAASHVLCKTLNT